MTVLSFSDFGLVQFEGVFRVHVGNDGVSYVGCTVKVVYMG